MNFIYKCLSSFWKKKQKKQTSFNFHIWMALGQGQVMTLNTHVVSFTYLANYIYQFSDHRLQ